MSLPAVPSTDRAEALAWYGQAKDAAESLQWMVGDRINQDKITFEGDHHFIPEAADRLGIPLRTLQEFAQVALAFPGEARVPALSFTHHVKASRADDPAGVLEIAAAQGLNVRDTDRLAKGLPLGGEDTAQAESSAVPSNVSLEESALGYLDAAVTALLTAESIMRKQGFRLTQPVGTKVMARLASAARPFQAIEALVEDEVGSLL